MQNETGAVTSCAGFLLAVDYGVYFGFAASLAGILVSP
jgi:hypothetical protein